MLVSAMAPAITGGIFHAFRIMLHLVRWKPRLCRPCGWLRYHGDFATASSGTVAVSDSAHTGLACDIEIPVARFPKQGEL